MARMNGRAILGTVFGDEAVRRMEGNAPYYLVDSSDVLTPLNDQGRCALSELATGGGYDVVNTPNTEPLVRRLVVERPELFPVANDVATALRSLVVANDNGRLRTAQAVAIHLDSLVDVSDQFAVLAIRG